MLTVKQFRIISLAVMLLAACLAIGGLSMSRFANTSLSSEKVGLEFTINIGAFHMCLDADVSSYISFCGTIDKDCVATLFGVDLPFSQSLQPDWYKDGCSKFNLFRGMLVTATLFICMALIVGSIHLCVNKFTSPKWSVALEITYCVLAGLSAIFYIISLVAVDQTISSVPTIAGKDSQGYNVSFKADKGTSFGLEGAAIAFLLIALILWVVARFVGRQPAATGLEGVPLNNGSSPSSSYMPPPLPGQPQQYFNYGAPPPQVNYQQYGNTPNMPPTNYGFGYQPPPTQTQ